MKSYDSETGGGGGFMMGIVCGAVVGAAVGLLLAPKSGADLRQQLSEKSGKLRQRAAEGYSAAAETVSSAVDQVMERGSDAVRRGKETYDHVRHAATDASNEAAQTAATFNNGRV